MATVTTDSTIFCGVDIGSQKTIIVASDGERILTSTGGTSRPTALSFLDRTRLLGEDAIPQLMSENTISFLNKLLGVSYREVIENANDNFGFLQHTRMKIVPLVAPGGDGGESGGLIGLKVSYVGPDFKDGESERVFSVPALLGMYLASLVDQVRAAYSHQQSSTHQPNSSKFILSFPIPSYDPNSAATRALREACYIAGITSSADENNQNQATGVYITNAVDSLARAYSRKLEGLKPAEKTHLENNAKVLIVEVGSLQSSVLLLEVLPDKSSVQIVTSNHSSSLGAFHFDLAIFHHLTKICEDKHKLKIVPGTKAAFRFLTACERLRKLLSQLPEASVTIENLSDEVGDLSFHLRRDELAEIGSSLVARFRALISDTLAGAGNPTLAAVEILGGGARMQIVQSAIAEFVGDLQLGAKLDDGSIAVGAALLAASRDLSVVTATKEEVETSGLSKEDLQAACAAEIKMQQQDRDIVRLLECRNEMEAYIFEMRGSANRKHSELIADKEALRVICDEYENWLWDNGELVSLQDITDKFESLKDKLEGPEVEVSLQSHEGEMATSTSVKRRKGGLCSEYLALLEKDKRDVEEMLMKEAAEAALEEKDEDEDHDFRKLRKPERMRMVVKNKDEGTELFKDGNIRPAAARYQKALSHAAKFFDLSPEDTEEVNAVKLSIYLNLTQCYLKLEKWDNAIHHADEALKLDTKSVKALFRRAQAFEAKKDYDKALDDMKRAAELNAPKEDKLITKGMDRVKKCIQKEKEKEKKMWGKAFS